MALTVLQRPEGHILSGTEITATVSEDYDGDALFTKTTHGLTTGDYVYVKGTIENYNGFWYAMVIDADKFNIRPNSIEENVDWIQNATVTYQESVSEHKWSCVHLPIIYRIRTNRWPTNEVNSIVGIASYANDEGYVRITTSSSYFVGWSELLYVKISGAADDRVNGIWQILELGTTPTTVTTLAMAYDPHYDFSGATLQVYFTSYAIRVNIYAGLDENHYWAGQKPFELIDTIDLAPDPENEVMFSISEKLLKHMQTRNNLTLSTLPNNLDFWTQFYITFQEIYDDSDGYTLFTAEDILNNDNAFKGYAVNAMLPFKNIHSGFLSEYVMRTGAFGKFLTLFATPVIFSGCYYDISFIAEGNTAEIVNENALAWANTDHGFNDWNLSIATVTFSTNGVSRTEAMYFPFKAAAGSYNFDYDVTVSGTFTATGDVRLGIVGLDASKTIITATSVLATFISGSTVNASGTAIFAPIAGIEYIALVVDVVGTKTSGAPTAEIHSFGFADSALITFRDEKYIADVLQDTTDTEITTAPGLFRMPIEAGDYDTHKVSVRINGVLASEELTLLVIDDCDDEVVQDTEIRLTEDGDFRILE